MRAEMDPFARPRFMVTEIRLSPENNRLNANLERKRAGLMYFPVE